MSRYLGRVYEGFYPKIDYRIYRYENLPVVSKDGDYALVYEHTLTNYYKFVNKEWKEVSDKDYRDNVRIVGYYSRLREDVPAGTVVLYNDSYGNKVKVAMNIDGELKVLADWNESKTNDYDNLRNIVNNKFSSVDELPTEDIPEGFYAVTNLKVPQKYYIKENGVWKETTERKAEWNELDTYRTVTDKPYESVTYDKDGNRQYETDFSKILEENNVIVGVTPKSKEILLNKVGTIWTCVGTFGDEYISNGGWSESNIDGRGLPDDISDYHKDYFSNDDSEENDIFKRTRRGYDHTYITASELYTLYDKEFKAAIVKLVNRLNEDNSDSLNEKLDFLMKHLKSSEEKYDKDYKKFLKDIKKKKDDEEDEWKLPWEEFVEETFEKVDAISTELSFIRLYANFYNIYDYEKIRVIYFIE